MRAPATRRLCARRRKKQPAPTREKPPRVGVSANGSARGCGAEGTRRESNLGWDKGSPLDGDAGGCGGRGGPPAPPPARDDERVDSSFIFCCVVDDSSLSDRSFSIESRTGATLPNVARAGVSRSRSISRADGDPFRVRTRFSRQPRSNAVARGRPRRAATRVRGRRPLVSRLVVSHEA
jgi:hypothetical protein